MVFKKIIFVRTNYDIEIMNYYEIMNYDIEKRSSVKLRLFLQGWPHPGENSAQPRAAFLPGCPSSNPHFPFILASTAHPGRNNRT